MSRFVGVTCKLICHGSTFAHCMHCYDQKLTKLTDLSTTHSIHPQALSSADHRWQGLDSWWSGVVTCLSVRVSHTQHSATLHNKRYVPQWLNTSQLTCPLYKVHHLAPLSDDHWWWGLEVRGSDLPVTVHLPHTTQCSTTQCNTTHAAHATVIQHQPTDLSTIHGASPSTALSWPPVFRSWPRMVTREPPDMGPLRGWMSSIRGLCRKQTQAFVSLMFPLHQHTCTCSTNDTYASEVSRGR